MLIHLCTRRSSDLQLTSSKPRTMRQPRTYIDLLGVVALVPASYLTAHLLISFEAAAVYVPFFFLSCV